MLAQFMEMENVRVYELEVWAWLDKIKSSMWPC